MSKKFPEHKKLDLSKVNKEILDYWHKHDTFRKSIQVREGAPTFVFYEGPPSANGMPGIHHVMARTIKDIFCRYKTMQGFMVNRKAGWDTHGLPVELGVEKALGITKEDIGKKISIADYNKECRKDVMKYTDLWEDLTEKMGYWVDMHNPYITYDNRYIETLWWLLRKLYDKGLIYKGYTIQPYSPAAGTGLSTHELNQPGCYRDVKDTTCVAQFTIIKNEKSQFLFTDTDTEVSFLAWTTTPWTLPSNTALAVGKDITYVKVRSFNPYSGKPITVILAKELASVYFNPKHAEMELCDYQEGSKEIPFKIIGECKGNQLAGINYEQLIPWVNPGDGAFRVVTGDFVTTEDGTGIVHIAPTFGADDDRVAKASGVPPLILFDKAGNRQPMVDRTGKFFLIDDIDSKFVSDSVDTQLYKEFAGRFVKNAYDPKLSENDSTLDVDICVMLKQQNKAFKIEKQVHNYPHCWRTDKPVLYYPLDSWFIKTTAMRDRMIELNNTINWKPESTGTGRFGKWLENLQDWNLSRSRYWGTPLPIWRTEDGSEEVFIGSVEDLKSEIEKAVKAGFMKSNPLESYVLKDYSAANYEKFDLHRPFVDDIILVSPTGKRMIRETDLIDVWFDSGAMPYAQIHYPFNGTLEGVYPADFIAEGVDQTRGWFFTLHAIAVMLFDSVAFKNIVSNGLVLDKNGNKMSKRLGNAVDPFETIEKYGSDPLRWYMITNASPWDNLKFDIGGIDEVTRKFFGTLYNTYSFFALYANVDSFTGNEPEVPVNERPEIDRWIISLLNSLIIEVGECYETYEPTRAGRAIQDFVIENLSNWYVRLNRKRFWGGGLNNDKLAAYQTLYTCLETITRLGSPIAPFFTDKIFIDLNSVTLRDKSESVHLANFPKANKQYIDKLMEEKMGLAQRISSMVLGLRRKVNIKVRQPLHKIIIPVLDDSLSEKIDAVKKLIITEVNVKDLEYISDTSGILVKKIKPNFKTLGPKYGKYMKGISAAIALFTQKDILEFEKQGNRALTIEGTPIDLTLEDVEIISEDIPGWLVANEGKLTVALDVTLTTELIQEGIAREFVNRIQNLRKETGLDVTDKITIEIVKHEAIMDAINNHKQYIGSQTLAQSISWVDQLKDTSAREIEIDDEIKTMLKISKIS
jgi:isoleucyl-tRNA synthetase